MGVEIDLLVNYPRTKRNPLERAKDKTEEDRAIARRFGKEFFDGERRHGYGGHYYNEKYWTPVAATFKEHYNLTENSTLLDVGCAKGFMLYDFKRTIGLKVKGIDISEYAIENAHPGVKEDVLVADGRNLPFEDNSFDLVTAITTVHNFDLTDCAKSLQEIQRVTKKDAFITVDAYRTPEEKELMDAWNLTAKTFMHVKEWEKFFEEVGYKGDYYWFFP